MNVLANYLDIKFLLHNSIDIINCYFVVFVTLDSSHAYTNLSRICKMVNYMHFYFARNRQLRIKQNTKQFWI